MNGAQDVICAFHPAQLIASPWFLSLEKQLADLARNRYESREKRLEREELDNVRRLALKAKNKAKALDLESAKTEDEKSEIERKRAIIAAAMARAQEKLQSSS